MMISKTAWIVRELALARSAGAQQVYELAECGDHIDEPESRNGAAHEGIGKKGVHPGNRVCEVVVVPERGPRDQDEQQTRLEEQGDEEQTSKQGE